MHTGGYSYRGKEDYVVSEADKSRLIDGVIGIQMQVLHLESSLPPERFQAFVTRLLERKVIGSRLWDFFKEVAKRDQATLVRLVVDDNDPRLAQYATG